MAYNPFTIQVQDENTEQWVDHLHLHALKVNKTGGGQTFTAGADQYRASLTFEVRWCKQLEALHYSTQTFRIVYRGHTFKVVDYDDYMEQHQKVKLVGEFYE